MERSNEFDDPWLDRWDVKMRGVDLSILNDGQRLTEISLALLKDDFNLTIRKVFPPYYFSPIGITLVIVLAESHWALHTWPERNFMHIDLVSCSQEVDLSRLPEVLQTRFNPIQLICRRIVD